jgi:aminoglycoside phosphotransferase (APT) family kinase protein
MTVVVWRNRADRPAAPADSVRFVPPPDAGLLAKALEPALGAPLQVVGLYRLSGGASRETWAFDAIDDRGEVRPLVLRRDPGAHVGHSDRSTEYELLLAAAAGGVPVPEVVHLLEPADDLGAGFVMVRVEGETIPRKILRDDAYAAARPVLAAQCGEIAARIHTIEPSTLPALPVLGAREQIEQHRELLDTFGEPHPAFELALQWLDRHTPDEVDPPRLVHGDFRNGNFIVGADGIRAVLDWELAHLGDPVEDLGWLCVKSWRFGAVDQVVGGFGSLDALLDTYQRGAYRPAGGAPRVELDALRFWVLFGTLKWGVICIAQAFTHLNGVVRSVELATLGRRVAEMEYDVLDLLEGGW